jgi:general secretion pathway protein I
MKAARQVGFTLIEMVIAFAIAGLSLSVLFAAFAGALDRIRHNVRMTEGTLIAQSLLARAETEIPVTEGVVTGDWMDYHFELTQVRLGAPVGEPAYTQPAERVTATVSWPVRSGTQQLALATLKLIPKGHR